MAARSSHASPLLTCAKQVGLDGGNRKTFGLIIKFRYKSLMAKIGSTVLDRLGDVVVMKTPLRIPRRGTGQGGGRTWVIMICDRDVSSIMGAILINWTRIAMVEAYDLDRVHAYWLSAIRETEKGGRVSIRTKC